MRLILYVLFILAGHTIMSRHDALTRAKNLDLDLVEVNVPIIVLHSIQVTRVKVVFFLKMWITCLMVKLLAYSISFD